MFKSLTETMMVSPQVDVGAVAAAARAGVALIINNRPDGEIADQPSGADIADAARSAGIAYLAIPVTHAGIAMPQVAAMMTALNDAGGPVLAYCRSGTRSTHLWAMARASQGENVDDLMIRAAGAGYDLSPLRATLEMLCSQG